MGDMSEKASLAERRSNALHGEMEEARSLLDSAERGKRQTEAELNEARGAVTEMNRALETTMGDMENRLAEANDSAMKGGKSAMAKLESRIRELEIELGSVQNRTGDSMKAHQKAERKVKEMQFQNDEDKKNQERMSELASKLQAKI